MENNKINLSIIFKLPHHYLMKIKKKLIKIFNNFNLIYAIILQKLK